MSPLSRELRLLRVEIDGGTFGLLDVSEPAEGPAFADWVAIEPGYLLFHTPWDGNYDTSSSGRPNNTGHLTGVALTVCPSRVR